MVKGAHRMLMHKLKQAPPVVSEADFQQRVTPALAYCVEIGNIYSATLYLALCGLLDTVDLRASKRVALYSYGSGCCSEFFSGIIAPESKAKMSALQKRDSLDMRYELSVQEYDHLLDLALEWRVWNKDKKAGTTP